MRAPAHPLSRRYLRHAKITPQMLLFAGTIVCVLSYPLYVYVESIRHQGIKPMGDVYEVDLMAMTRFDIDQVDADTEDIPQRWRELDGKRVKLKGEMLSPYATGGRLSGFDLVYSIVGCHFSGPPKVQNYVRVTVPPNAEVNFRPGFVHVIGTLEVGVEKAKGRIKSVFRLKVEDLRPA